MIKLFNDKFVHFRWTDELKDKMCFVADDIDELENNVSCPEDRVKVGPSSLRGCYPFLNLNSVRSYRFCYHDSHYDIKVAFNEGKTIQCQGLNEDGSVCWFDVEDEDDLLGFIAQNRYLQIKSDTVEVIPVIPVNPDYQKFKEIIDSLNDHLERIEKLEKELETIKQIK